MKKFLGIVLVLLGILILLKGVFGMAVFLVGVIWFSIKLAAALILIWFGLSFIRRKRKGKTTLTSL